MRRFWLGIDSIGLVGICGVRRTSADRQTPRMAAVYFVTVDGSDAHDGRSVHQAFATIQRGF